MKKMYKRTLAMLLAALMTAGTFMVPSSAVKSSDEILQANTSAPANAFTGKQFTGTADLIQDSIKYVLENGVAPEGGQEDWLAEAVEAQSGMSLDAVTSGIYRGIVDKENNGYMDTAIYRLDETTMEAVVEHVLVQYYLANAVTCSLDVEDGVAVGIYYEMKEALSIALDEIEVNAAIGNDESAISDIVESAEANAAERFDGETNFEGEEIEGDEQPEEQPEEQAHVHVYTDPAEVVWGTGYNTCTATFTCMDCAEEAEGHVLTETTTNVSYVDGEENTIAAVFNTNEFTATTTVDEHIHIYNPNDSSTFTFGWATQRVLNDDADGDGQPDFSMVYDPTYDPATDPYYNPETGMGKYVMYEPNTGIGISVMNKIEIVCTGLTIQCTGCDEVIQIEGTDEGIITETRYLNAAGEPVTSPEEMVIMEMMAGAYVLTPELVFSTYFDAAEYRLKIHWSEMSYFFREHPEYYGTSADFWTSKNTEASPLQAIKVLCNMGDMVFVPNPTMDYMVEMLTQAFIAYVMQYGYMLQYIVYDAMACIDDSMTDIQKMLVMHDWLAKNATFDMQSLVDSKSGESAGADPISFTPFGTLLANQIGTDGAICLGYAAAYNFLLQYVFAENYRNAEGEWLAPEEADHIVDFVQIKFHTNVADSSVAGGNSGFGEGIFNEPHYFNAVRLPDSETGMGSDYWYYVDACYDDISVEVISQYRVETDGNISHMYFLSSPQSFVDQFEGNFDYFDSAYDGWTWVPNYLYDENGDVYMDESGMLATEKDEDGYTIYTQYQSEDEIMYDDDQFEQTWFSNIMSEVLFDGEYWYYVEGPAGSYASMKDMMGDNNMGGNGGFEMDSDMLSQFTDDPSNADKLKRRGREFGDRPEETENDNNNNMFGSSLYEDPHAEVLFHYGYGSVGAPETDAEGNALNGKYYDQVVIDKEFSDKYPDLVHSVALYKNKLYFNLGSRVMQYNLKNSVVKQLKEYNTVHSMTNGKRFTGMSFYSIPSVDHEAYTFTVKDHPVAALTINQVVTWERDEQGNPIMDENGMPIRHVTPSMYVSIATNYSNSNAVDDIPYVEEAVNFNPDFYRFMSDEEETEETNTNEEFMWCANIVDVMPMEAMINDMNMEYVVVHEDSGCGYAGFDEPRSPAYGLSDGTEKVESDAEALEHHFIYNNDEEVYICFRCLNCVDQTYVDENAVPTGHIISEAYEFVWAEDYSYCELYRGCEVSDCDAKTVDLCDVTSEEKTEEEVIVYTATFVDESGEYKDTKEVSNHKHTLTTEPVFTWDRDEDGNVIATITFACVSETCPVENGYAETYDCDVTSEEDLENGVIIYTATYEEYSDTLEVTKHYHTLNTDPEFIWGEDENGNVVAEIVFVCTSDDCDVDGYEEIHSCNVVCEEDADREVLIYTASYDVYSDTMEVSTHVHTLTTEPVFTWGEDAEGNVTAIITFVCVSENCNEEDYKEEHDCEINIRDDEENEVFIYTATFEEYTDTKTVEKEHTHKLTTEPVFTWGEDAEGNVTATITFVCVSDKCDVEDYVETYECEITSDEDAEKEVIIYTASYDVYSDTKEVDNHKCVYGAPEFIWSDDAASCTAVFTCEKCSDTEDVECTVDQKSVDPDTGDTTFTANCTFNGKNYSDEKVVAHTDHVYEISEFIWATDNSACTAIFVCTKCSESNEDYAVEVECDVEEEIVIAPSIGENGLKRFTATCTFNGQEYSDEKDVEISAYGEIDLHVSDLLIKSNQEAQMVISIEKLPENGLGYLSLEIDYDAEYLTLVNAEATTIIGDVTKSKTFEVKPYIVNWDTIEKLEQTGVILTLTFKAGDVQSFEEGMSIVSVKCKQCFDIDYNELNCNINEFKTSLVVPGDANSDGKVDGRDLLVIRKYAAEYDDVTINIIAADVNADGEVDGKDVIVMRQYLAGWDDVVLQ